MNAFLSNCAKKEALSSGPHISSDLLMPHHLFPRKNIRPDLRLMDHGALRGKALNASTGRAPEACGSLALSRQCHRQKNKTAHDHRNDFHAVAVAAQQRDDALPAALHFKKSRHHRMLAPFTPNAQGTANITGLKVCRAPCRNVKSRS